MSAISTGETDKKKAQFKAELWKANGIPTGRLKTPRPLAEVAGIDSIIKAIRRADLNSDDALRIVSTLKSMGLIDIAAVANTGRGSVPFVEFLEKFWSYNESEYIQDKLAHGYRFTRRHAYECRNKIKAEIKPFFGDKKLNCVTTVDLRALSRNLADRGLATSTINQILLVCKTPLKWAYNEKIIPDNPCLGLTSFSITNKERGILTETEAIALFAIDWKDKRAYVVSLVAATTGARQGECLALRLSDIGTDTLNIACSYSPFDGLKCPKNGHKRVVPLLPEVRTALLDMIKDSPHSGIDDPFVFYSLQPDRPCDQKVLLDGLKEAMESVNREYEKAAIKANLDKPEIKIDYKGRNITFHSWRHWFCSKITELIDGEKVAKVSDHLSESVFKKYADHIEAKNIQDVGNAAAQAFGNVLQFRKAV